MKADENFELGLFDEKVNKYWYEMGKNTYLGDNPSTEIPADASKEDLLSFRKGILDAARNLGDLERMDFHSEGVANFYSENASNAHDNNSRATRK